MADSDLVIALRYDADGGGPPRVTAKGRGAIAAQILAIAEDRGIAVHRDPDLVALLGALELNTPIPVAAFAAVAEILAHLHRANRRLAGHTP